MGFGDTMRGIGEWARNKLPGEQRDLYGNRINTGRGLAGAAMGIGATYLGGALGNKFTQKPIENWVNKYNPSYQGNDPSHPFDPADNPSSLGYGQSGFGDWNVSGGGSSGNFGPFGPGGGPNGMAQGGDAPNYQGSVNGQMPFNPSSPGLTGPATNVNIGGEAPPSGSSDLGFGRSGFGDWNVSGGGTSRPAYSGFTGNRSGGTLGGGTAVDPSQWGQFGFGQSSPDVMGPMQALQRMGGGMSEGAGVRGGGMNPALAAAYWRSHGGAQTGGGGQMTPTNTGVVPPSVRASYASTMTNALRRPPIKKII